MACGCGGKKSANGVVNASRGMVYKVVMPDGTVVGEHDSAVLARNQASSVGGRVRPMGKSSSPTP